MTALYRFGQFELSPATRQLLVDQQPAPLGARAFDVLLALIERRDRLVTKNELLDLVWPGLVVEENNLQVQISALRKVLGQEAIATVPGRGYRFTIRPRDSEPPDSDPPAPRNNLPHPLTSFVGRRVDLDEYAKLLVDNRLLTLTGIGGCGKTRLAIKLAERMMSLFPGGVWFVDLAPVAEPEHVTLAMATALGVREEPDKAIEETLKRHLTGKTLLILDNCEHLVGTCTTLVDTLLAALPVLHVLVTSREGLGLAGERTVSVRSLALPSPGEPPYAAAALGYDAISLFVDRARLVAPEFALNAANTPAVIEICQRLDGIPIAIELAAARMKLLSPDQIRAKLDDRFRLLTGGTRAMSRHQTLLATMQWSYEHLTADEQRLFRRFAVFAGGCSLAAVTAVAGENCDEMVALDHLGRLVDKSLILVERGAGEPRYRMLETVRQYAQDRLNDSSESKVLRDRHLAYFLAWAKANHPRFFTDEASAAWQQAEFELPNLLAAHSWCDHTEVGATLGLELAANLRLCWINGGAFALGQQVYDEALARDGVPVRSMLRAQVLFAMSQHNFFRGRLAEVVAAGEAARAIALDNGDHEWAWRCMVKIAQALAWSGDFARALDIADEALAVARGMGNLQFVSTSLIGKGEVHRAAGQFGLAAEAYDQALLSYGDQRRPHNINYPVLLLSVARGAIFKGDLERARHLLDQVVRLNVEWKLTNQLRLNLEFASNFFAASGNLELAATLQGAADAAADRMGGVRNKGEDQLNAELRERPRLLLGAEAYAAAYAAGRELSLDEAIDLVLASLSSVQAEHKQERAVLPPRREG